MTTHIFGDEDQWIFWTVRDDRRRISSGSGCGCLSKLEVRGKDRSDAIGTLAAFDAKSQSWEEYCEILEQFFEANGTDEGDR